MASDKGKIKDFDSFVPENGGFFEKSEIFSKSKHQAISNSEYDDPRSIGWEISAIWVILVNPRCYNSASTLSGCIKRSKSKVILALPTWLNIIQFFEKTLIVGFSSVNMRAAFETEILLLNFSVKDMNKLNIHQSFGIRLQAATR